MTFLQELCFWTAQDEEKHPRGSKGSGKGGQFVKKSYKGISGKEKLDPEKERDPIKTLSRAASRKVSKDSKVRQNRSRPYYKNLIKFWKKYDKHNTQAPNAKDLWGAFYEKMMGQREAVPAPSRYYDIPEDDPGTWFTHKNYGDFIKLDRNNPPEAFVKMLRDGEITLQSGMSNIYISTNLGDKKQTHVAGYIKAGKKSGKGLKWIVNEGELDNYKANNWSLIRKMEKSGAYDRVHKKLKNNLKRGKGSRTDAMLLLISETGLRVGSQAEENRPGIFGARTFLRKHLTRNAVGDIRIKFKGKGGKLNQRTITHNEKYNVDSIMKKIEPLQKKRIAGKQFNKKEKIKALTAFKLLEKIAKDNIIYSPHLNQYLGQKMRALKDNEPVFGVDYPATNARVKTLFEDEGGNTSKMKVTAHNFRHYKANQVAKDLMHSYYTMLPEPEDEKGFAHDFIGNMKPNKSGGWVKRKTKPGEVDYPEHYGIRDLVGFFISDTGAPAETSYIDPKIYANIKKGAGVPWKLMTPTKREKIKHETGKYPTPREILESALTVPPWME